MKRLITVLAASLVMAAPYAFSQAAPNEAPIGPTASVNLNLEQQHTIKEVVKDEQLPKVVVNFPMSVGATVPASVALQPMPTLIGQKVPSVKTHRLFVTENRIVLVNPNDRRIAQVLDESSSTGQSDRR